MGLFVIFLNRWILDNIEIFEILNLYNLLVISRLNNCQFPSLVAALCRRTLGEKEEDAQSGRAEDDSEARDTHIAYLSRISSQKLLLLLLFLLYSSRLRDWNDREKKSNLPD